VVLCQLFDADIAALKEQEVRAQAEKVVIGVSLPSVRGGAQRACEEFGPVGDRGGFFGGVVARCPMTFMEQTRIVVP